MVNQDIKTAIDNFIPRSFEWGKYDCILFAAASIDAAIDSSYYNTYCGKWDSLQSALKFAKHKDLSVEKVVASIGKTVEWGCEENGDIVITEDQNAPLLSKFSSGVVFNNRMFFMTLNGLCALPMDSIPEPKGIYRCLK